MDYFQTEKFCASYFRFGLTGVTPPPPGLNTDPAGWGPLGVGKLLPF